MTEDHDIDLAALPGDRLVRVLAALSNPHRLRILAALSRGGGRLHVSLLAREVALSRPLVHMHLQRLEGAGLVAGHLEVSPEGKAMKFFEVTPFVLRLTPDVVSEAARTLTDTSNEASSPNEKENSK